MSVPHEASSPAVAPFAASAHADPPPLSGVAVKSGKAIRVIDTSPTGAGGRTLLRGFSTAIVDMEFSLCDPSMIAAVSSAGEYKVRRGIGIPV